MKKILLILLMIFTLPVLASDSPEFVVSPHNLEVSNEIESRIADGLHFGENRRGEECSVEIEGSSIQIKTADFQEDPEEEQSCSQRKNIACFEFSPLMHAPSKGLFATGDLFRVRVRAKNKKLLHLHTVRKISGTGEYLLLIDKYSGRTSITVTEVREGMIRKLDCSINI